MPSTLDRNVRLLAKVPLLSGLTEDELAQVAALGREATFDPGDALMTAGDRGHEFMVLLAGEVEIRRENGTTATARDGDFFGEVALVCNLRRTATITATTPVKVLVVRDAEFRELLLQHPEVSLKLLEAFAERLPHEG